MSGQGDTYCSSWWLRLVANRSTSSLGSNLSTSCLNTPLGSDHSVDIAMLRDSWSATTLKDPLMCAAERVQFISDALFHIISAIEAR